MLIKLFLLLALAAVGALAQEIDELEFTLEGRRYTETVVDGEDFKVVVVPKQGIADHTMVMHDFETRLTVFKDLTTSRCIVIPMDHMLVRVRGLIFRDRQSTSEAVPSIRNNIMLDVDGDGIEDIETEAGQKITNLCRGFAAFWARISREESTFSMSSRRLRRSAVSISVSGA